MTTTIQDETLTGFQIIADLLAELSLANTIEEVAALVCEQGRSLAGVDGVTFIVIDQDQACYIDEASDEPIFKGEVIPLDQCICGWSLTQNTPAFVADVVEDDRTDSTRFESTFISSLAMIPLRNPEPIGAIGFYFARPHDFPKKEIQIMQCLASAAEFAMRNVTTMSQIDVIVSERTEALQSVNAELESFAYTVSHDLKNPLSVIKTNCWTITELLAGEVSEKALESVNRIDAAAIRMTGQIESMLSMYRIAKNDIDGEDVDLSLIAKSIVEELAGSFPDRKMDFKIDSGIHAYGDRAMFTVMMENLLSNAIKYSKEAKPAVIEFFTKETDQELGPVFCVRDNGFGFDKESAEKIFQVFKRLPETRDIEGHGIGLSSVQRIINKHGGNVWAEGEHGKGASFFFTLPALSIDTDLEDYIGA